MVAELFPGKMRAAADPGQGYTTGRLKNQPGPSHGVEPQLTDDVDLMNLGLPESPGKSYPDGNLGAILAISTSRCRESEAVRRQTTCARSQLGKWHNRA